VADESIELGPILPTDLDHVFEAPVGHQHDPGPISLEQRVGRNGRAVQKREVPAAVHDLRDAVQNRLSGIGWSRRHLEGLDAPVLEIDEVRERATGVDGQHGR
jgi:hypothetical protein